MGGVWGESEMRELSEVSKQVTPPPPRLDTITVSVFSNLPLPQR